MHKHYSRLGLANGADKASIKIAFRRLAAVFHPDRNAGSSLRFREICHAYQTLISHVETAHRVPTDDNPTLKKNTFCKSQAFSNNRRLGRRGSPADRRYACISENEYKGVHLRTQA
ncbi:MAG: J domain-containing protein [Bermanella sp.]